MIGLSDIVRSTAAIEAGRYKTVNTAAASVIAAITNALGDGDFPFVFGGDGASFVLPPDHADLARSTLAAVAAWVRDDLDLEPPVRLMPVAAVRAAGLDIRIARFAASADVSYAMFSGGGLAFAERDEGRRLRDHAGAAGHAGRPQRPLLPLRRDPRRARRRSSP